MSISPILSTLSRHKTASILIILQVAVACAILCNATFLVSERVQRMVQPSGVDEKNLVMITSIGLDTDKSATVRINEDLATLANVPGVEAVTDVGQFPFASNSWNTGLTLKEGQEEPSLIANMVTASRNFQKVSGLKMKQGRWFDQEEFQDIDLFSGDEYVFPYAVITEGLAQRLYPGENPIGKIVYGVGKGPSRVIGVTENMIAPGGQPSGDEAAVYSTIFVPTSGQMSWYVLRTTPEQRNAVMKAGSEALSQADSNRIVGTPKTLEEMRAKYYSRDRAVTWLLVVVSILLLAITAFGIGGLASFWVQQRTKQIGVRRALGATKQDILRYFQTENFIIVTAGVVLGMALAFGINQLLMNKYELPRLPFFYLPVGALLLWILGQIAILAPALRAASIPPATATRSV